MDMKNDATGTTAETATYCLAWHNKDGSETTGDLTYSSLAEAETYAGRILEGFPAAVAVDVYEERRGGATVRARKVQSIERNWRAVRTTGGK